MNRAIEKDLFILVPSISSTGLPSELIHLATSLLAQSRSKASSLKPDEEIARSFCCAHVACERLKTKLDLPDIQVRPPCSKKVYGKLFSFLDSVLTANLKNGTSRPGSSAGISVQTPSKRKRVADDDRPITPKQVVDTQSRRMAMRSKDNTPSSNCKSQENNEQTITKKRTANTEGFGDHEAIPETFKEEDLPDWIMKSIRAVCKEMKLGELAPHVWAAFVSVLKELCAEKVTIDAAHGVRSRKKDMRRRDDYEFAAETVPPLLLAMLAKVISKNRLAKRDDEDDNADGEVFFSADAVLEEMFNTQDSNALSTFSKSLPAPIFKLDDLKEMCVQILTYCSESGLWDLEAFENVIAFVQSGNTARTAVDEEDDIDMFDRELKFNPQDTGRQGSRGGGEMLNHAIDWLSIERRRDFMIWKERVTNAIEQAEELK